MTDAAIRSRADELLSGMTPAEKAGQLTQYFYFRLPPGAEPALDLDVAKQPLMVEAALGQGAVGSLLFVTDPAEVNRLQRLAIEGNRLGIPALFGFDVIHGLRTIFPVPIAMAASWDLETIEAGQAVAAREARSARPSASSPAPSTSPDTAPPSAGATTTRSTSPTPSSGTSTSRRSRRLSRPAPAT